MPLIYSIPGRAPVVLRKPPTHFVLSDEADLISENSVRVYRSFVEDVRPAHMAKKMGSEELLEYESLVGRMFLCESVDGGSDYRITYQGDENVEAYGSTPEHHLSDKPASYVEPVMEILNLVQSSKSVVVNGPAVNAFPERLFMISQTLFMPVFIQDNQVLQIMGYEEFFHDGKVEKI